MRRNGPKQTISTSGELGLLQMILESVIERCVNENAGPQRRWIVRSTSVGGGNEAYLIRVWKPLSSRRVLES